MKSYSRIVGLPGLSNVGVVKEGLIYRCAAPEGVVGYKTLRNILGVKTVVNLRTHSEAEAVTAAGMTSIEHALNVFSNIAIADFDMMISVLDDSSLWPLAFHCRQGHDRTGVLCGAYRSRVDGWSIQEAEEEMQAYGYNDLWFVLKRALRQYAVARGLK